jgi:DnaJ-class molecular chaperone with C-terminal Zn finger domain
LRLSKKGFVDLKGNKGDLYLEVEIVNPENMTKEQEELYRKLKEITNQNINN